MGDAGTCLVSGCVDCVLGADAASGCAGAVAVDWCLSGGYDAFEDSEEGYYWELV